LLLVLLFFKIADHRIKQGIAPLRSHGTVLEVSLHTAVINLRLYWMQGQFASLTHCVIIASTYFACFFVYSVPQYHPHSVQRVPSGVPCSSIYQTLHAEKYWPQLAYNSTAVVRALTNHFQAK